MADAERKIYFYRAFPMDEEDGWSLDRKGICDAIGALKGTNDFYLDDGDDKITCAEVGRDQAPQSIKFYSIRRQDLPSRDDGAGVISDLDLAAEEGLAEAVHVRLFPNNVIAAEFFYYGPRISRIHGYLNARCDQDIYLRPFIRGDLVQSAMDLKDIRLLRIKVHPSEVSRQEARELGFDKVMAAAKEFDADIAIDVTMRSEKYNDGLTNRAKHLIGKVSDGDGDAKEIFANLEVGGTDSDGRVEYINLLSEQLVRVAKIPKESARTRALDSPAAFRAIKDAYDEVKHLLTSDAVAE